MCIGGSRHQSTHRNTVDLGTATGGVATWSGVGDGRSICRGDVISRDWQRCRIHTEEYTQAGNVRGQASLRRHSLSGGATDKIWSGLTACESGSWVCNPWTLPDPAAILVSPSRGRRCTRSHACQEQVAAGIPRAACGSTGLGRTEHAPGWHSWASGVCCVDCNAPQTQESSFKTPALPPCPYLPRLRPRLPDCQQSQPRLGA